MNLKLIGLDHKTATIAEREAALEQFKGRPGILLATCNRVELYCIDPKSEFRNPNNVVRHLFRVAAGLESQVLGESEILGQVRAAWLKAEEKNKLLDELFEAAIAVGKKVRQQTSLSKGNVSVASLAVAKAKQFLPDIRQKKALIIGSGKVAETVLKNLIKSNFDLVLVANRTFDRAQAMAEMIGGKAVQFTGLADEVAEADLIICSTSAPHQVLKLKQISGRRKPLVIIDLAVPRDVDQAVAGLPGVTLLNIDDIKEAIDLNLLQRQLAAIEAEQIINAEVELFCARYALAAAPVS